MNLPRTLRPFGRLKALKNLILEKLDALLSSTRSVVENEAAVREMLSSLIGTHQAQYLNDQRRYDNLTGVIQSLRAGMESLSHRAGDLATQVDALSTDLRQQVGDLHQELLRLQQYVDHNTGRRMLNEITSTSQAVQLLLCQKYRELPHTHLPSPELADTEFRCFSQNGEDGILLYIFSILGATNRRVVEISAGDGIECNSANLIINHGWYGLLFDGDEQNISRGKEFYSKCQDAFLAPPTLVASWITVENVNLLIADHGFAGVVDLLSLDIDGMDYWVWRALECISPRVIILEFNPIWGPDRAVSVPYQADYRIDYSRRPYYAGGSLSAFVKLGREKGYRLVGTQRLGFNALFVRSGVGEDLLPEISSRQCFERHRVLRNWGPHWIPDDSEWPEWKNIVEV
jgi:hypothetical protein